MESLDRDHNNIYLRHRGISQGNAFVQYMQHCVKRQIYEAAKDGMTSILYSLLNKLSLTEANNSIDSIEIDGQMRCTPLIIAAKNGHKQVVKMLLMRYKPNLELEGSALFDGYLIEGVTALWCASGGGHLSIVKSLIEHGADINHATKTNSTPLRAACFDGRLDIVKYLVEHKANIDLSNKYNNSCLMIAAYKGHLEVVEYLLSLGPDPNVKALCGASALHFAAENGHIDICKALLSNRAEIFKNSIGMTPVMSAAERTKSHIVEYFINEPYLCDDLERIDALELLGASYANDKDNYDLEKAFFYMKWAMKLRFKDKEKPILKKLMPQIAAYDFRIECQTLKELEGIQNNNSALHMEALVIRERILGIHNPEVARPVIFRGAVFADCSRFDRCLQLWLHALRLRTFNAVSIKKDLLRFAQVFSQIINMGQQLPNDILIEVLNTALNELCKNKESLCKCSDVKTKDSIHEELDDNLHTVLYLLVIITKIVKFRSKLEAFELYQFAYKLNRLNLKTKDGSSLLHLCVSADTPIDDFYTKNVCKFPCADTTKLLIDCGADVNALDENRNTPLHLIVSYQKPISDFLTLHSITSALIDSGAHMDAVNQKGQTPLQTATTGVAEILLKTHIKLSLKCMAAKVVKLSGLKYESFVPSSLHSFIEIHGASPKH